jgi:hypothetical protein
MLSARMEQPVRKDRSAIILLRMSGIAFVLLGIGVLFVTYLAVTAHPAQAAHPERGAVIGISISVLGVAATLLRRWAVVLLSAFALAFSCFASWAILRSGGPLHWSILLSMFYMVIAVIPVASMYFAWRELR